MPHISILKEMFKNEMLVPLESNPHDAAKKKVTLAEGDLYSVVINGLPSESNVVVIKTDNFSPLSAVFQGAKGECKRADFVIFSDVNGKKIILYLELKSTSRTEKETHIIKQLKGAQCVIRYCKEIGQVFWDAQFLEGFEPRFVCLRNINIPKRTTRHTNASQVHDTPENMLKINSPNYLQFNMLIGRPNI